MNAHRERIIAIELCDHVVILNQSHADRVLGAYQRHHNGPRPPQGRHQPPPGADQQPITAGR
jgi:putative transposase